MTEIDEILAKNSEARLNNEKAWKYVESRLDKIQGKKRSKAYLTYKVFSISYTPMGSALYDKLMQGMTKKERKLLSHG